MSAVFRVTSQRGILRQCFATKDTLLLVCVSIHISQMKFLFPTGMVREYLLFNLLCENTGGIPQARLELLCGDEIRFASGFKRCYTLELNLSIYSRVSYKASFPWWCIQCSINKDSSITYTSSTAFWGNRPVVPNLWVEIPKWIVKCFLGGFFGHFF